MKPEHCMTIALAFIATIAACATLITSANNKAESLAGRIRDAAKEHRERKNPARCRQLEEQVELFKGRFRSVQKAQRLLFATIAMFISSLAALIILALYLDYNHLSLVPSGFVFSLPMFLAGVCVPAGTTLMLVAIYLQFTEVGKSYATLCVETIDCPSPPPKGVAEMYILTLASDAHSGG